MVAITDVESLVRCVAEFYPSQAKKFSAKRATSILDESFRGVDIGTLCETVSQFAGSRPDDKAPPWEAIKARLISQRKLTPPGMRNDAMRIKDAYEEAEWQKRNATRISVIEAIPEDRWAEVCQLASDLFPMVPEDWRRKPYWVLALCQAWHRIENGNVAPPAGRGA